jgi:hypothetical protein
MERMEAAVAEEGGAEEEVVVKAMLEVVVEVEEWHWMLQTPIQINHCLQEVLPRQHCMEKLVIGGHVEMIASLKTILPGRVYIPQIRHHM